MLLVSLWFKRQSQRSFLFYLPKQFVLYNISLASRKGKMKNFLGSPIIWIIFQLILIILIRLIPIQPSISSNNLQYNNTFNLLGSNLALILLSCTLQMEINQLKARQYPNRATTIILVMTLYYFTFNIYSFVVTFLLIAAVHLYQ